jgi:hypothetical protein
MMNAITDKHLQVPAIEHHWNVHGDFLVRILQKPVQTLFEIQLPRGCFKPGVGGLIYVKFIPGN